MIIFKRLLILLLPFVILRAIYTWNLIFKAKNKEKEKDYKEACYLYARAYSFWNFRYCKKKIRNLWKNYGSFDYADKIDKLCNSGNPYDACTSYNVSYIIKKINKIIKT